MSAYDEAAAWTAAELAAESVQRAKVVRSWRASTPVGAMSIEHGQDGVWNVTLEGFSRSANRSLEAAVAEATGTNHAESWVQRLVAELEGTSQAPEHA